MDTTTFYAATSALCFTLLGFWWVVVQFRHEELTRDVASRRFIFLVSLHFIVPGRSFNIQIPIGTASFRECSWELELEPGSRYLEFTLGFGL